MFPTEALFLSSRPNPRNYTTVSNSGVTRSEKLTGWRGGGGQPQELPPGGDMAGLGLAREVGKVTNDDLAGLEECFRKVCKVSHSTWFLPFSLSVCLSVCLSSLSLYVRVRAYAFMCVCMHA